MIQEQLSEDEKGKNTFNDMMVFGAHTHTHTQKLTHASKTDVCCLPATGFMILYYPILSVLAVVKAGLSKREEKNATMWIERL